VRVVQRDLAAEPPPHPGRDLYDAILSPTPDDDDRFALSERYISELERADIVVIGTPMNNFSVCQITVVIDFLLTDNEARLFAISAYLGLGFSGIIRPMYSRCEVFPVSEESRGGFRASRRRLKQGELPLRRRQLAVA
jgi:hypothetical protein